LALEQALINLLRNAAWRACGCQFETIELKSGLSASLM
jgi:hypothetical protein